MEELLKPINIIFEPVFVKTYGDIDKKRSLKNLPKDDFFTREVEQLHFKGSVDLSIHSLKDLPERLQEGLVLVAVTKGIDSRDALVFSKNLDIETPFIVGTSSKSREKNVLKIFPKAVCKDIRGTIEERIEQMDFGFYNGVVIAEAAILRLGLLDLKRIYLKGATAKGQGQLAIVARADDLNIKKRLLTSGIEFG